MSGSVYPANLDSFSTSHQDNVNEVIHAADINNLADAVNKIEGALGTYPVLTPTAVKTSAYSANPGDLIPVDTTSGAVTITLPNAPIDKTRIAVQMVTQSGTNAVTIAASGSDVFDKLSGSTTLTLKLLNQGVLLHYAATNKIWYAERSLSLTQLDLRYPVSSITSPNNGDLLQYNSSAGLWENVNGGSLSATPAAADASIVYGIGFSWTAGRAYRDGNDDGLVYLTGWTDASGSSVGPTHSKVFGANAITKTGHGDLDGFWASIDHQGDGEVGLFIGDVTADAAGLGGNIWGGHFLLNLPIAANAYGHRVEFNPTVSQAGKTSIGLEVKNDSASNAITQAIRVTGNFTTPVAIYSDAAGTTLIFSVDTSGNISKVGTIASGNITSGTVSATGQIQSTTSADGAVLFRFNTDRPWKFIQDGTAGSTALDLMPESASKIFKIIDSNRTLRSLEVLADGTAPYVKLAPDAGGKVSFFGAAVVAQQTSAGNVHTVTAGSTTTVFVNTTFDGSNGSTAYTVGDIVKALKAYGLLAV